MASARNSVELLGTEVYSSKAMMASRGSLPMMESDLFESIAGSASALPERRLLAAVLFDAVLQLARRGSAGAADSAHWIRNRDDDDMPFSFSAVCEGLGLDADYLARGLLAWNPESGENGAALPSRRALAAPRRHRVALPAGPRRRRSDLAAS